MYRVVLVLKTLLHASLAVTFQNGEDIELTTDNNWILQGIMYAQWKPSCEATPFAPEIWTFKRGGLSSGVEINTFMFRFTLSGGLSRGGGLSKGVPLYFQLKELIFCP